MIHMNEQQQQGVIASVRAAAPQAVQPAQTSVAPVQITQQPVQQQAVQQPMPSATGFNAQPLQNGFAPQPYMGEPTFVPQPVQQPLITDNSRTAQQFEKLSESNQRLAQQNQERLNENQRLRQELETLQRQRQLSNQQFAAVQPTVPGTPAQQPSALPKLSDYIQVDPVSGQRWVDEDQFNRDYQTAANSIFEKATRAEETVQKYVQTAEQREIARQESEAFAAYPQLNPRGGTFDARLSQNTRAILYDSFMNPQDYPGGRPLSFKDAAAFVAGGASAQPNAIATPTVNTENAVQKMQAATTVPNVPQQALQGVAADEAYGRLVMGTRVGSDEAIAIRLKNATHRLADVEQQLAER